MPLFFFGIDFDKHKRQVRQIKFIEIVFTDIGKSRSVRFDFPGGCLERIESFAYRRDAEKR